MSAPTNTGPAVASPAAGPDPAPRTTRRGCPRCLSGQHSACLRFFPHGPHMAFCRCWCRNTPNPGASQ